jgi:outer membrane protein assembly factor BamB
MVALPSSVIVAAGHKRVEAFDPGGRTLWSFSLPDNDTVVSAPVASLNSICYIRGAQSVYAIAPDGKVIWQAKHDDPDGKVKGIVTLGDSTVAVTKSDSLLINYSATGQPRWTFTMPDGDRLTAPLVNAPNSIICMRGAAKIYAVDSGGNLSWQADFSGE